MSTKITGTKRTTITTSKQPAKKTKVSNKDTTMKPMDFIAKHFGYDIVWKGIVHANMEVVKYAVEEYDVDPGKKHGSQDSLEIRAFGKPGAREIFRYLEEIVKERKE